MQEFIVSSQCRKIALAALLGAVGGALVVGVATRAIPRMMSAMMREMMGHMAEAGCNPRAI